MDVAQVVHQDQEEIGNDNGGTGGAGSWSGGNGAGNPNGGTGGLLVIYGSIINNENGTISSCGSDGYIRRC